MRMIDVVTVLLLLVADSVVRHSAYMVAMLSMMPKPIFCPSGIFNRTIIGIGMAKRTMSEMILATAMMIYMTA